MSTNFDNVETVEDLRKSILSGGIHSKLFEKSDNDHAIMMRIGTVYVNTVNVRILTELIDSLDINNPIDKYMSLVLCNDLLYCAKPVVIFHFLAKWRQPGFGGEFVKHEHENLRWLQISYLRSNDFKIPENPQRFWDFEKEKHLYETKKRIIRLFDIKDLYNDRKWYYGIGCCTIGSEEFNVKIPDVARELKKGFDLFKYAFE